MRRQPSGDKSGMKDVVSEGDGDKMKRHWKDRMSRVG